MNIKRITAILAFAAVASLAAAQTDDKPVRIAASVTLGPNSYSTVTAPQGTLPVYEAEAPSADWTGKVPAFGIECSVIFRSGWRIDLGGGYGFTSNPGYAGLEGTADGNVLEPGDVPAYRAVASQNSNSYLLYITGSRYFNIPSVPALKPYAGMRALCSYAQNWKEYNESSSMGRSVSESLAAGVSAVAGIDYFFNPSLYFGAAFDVLRYVYSYTAQRPQEGLGTLAANSHSIGAFASPVLKIGFIF